MKNYRIKTSFISPDGPKANKTGIITIIFHFIIRGNFSDMHGFSMWLRTGSNPADINRFRSLLEKQLRHEV